MKRTAGMVIYHEDRLVIRWRDPKGGRIFSQGKRVAADCPLDPQTIKCYVKGGTIAAVKYLRLQGMSIRNAKDLIDSARGAAVCVTSRASKQIWIYSLSERRVK